MSHAEMMNAATSGSSLKQGVVGVDTQKILKYNLNILGDFKQLSTAHTRLVNAIEHGLSDTGTPGQYTLAEWRKVREAMIGYMDALAIVNDGQRRLLICEDA